MSEKVPSIPDLLERVRNRGTFTISQVLQDKWCPSRQVENNIYIIRDLENEIVYVGKTVISVYKRFMQHTLRVGCFWPNYKNEQNRWSWTVEILVIPHDTFYDLETWEAYYIWHLKPKMNIAQKKENIWVRKNLVQLA